MKNYVIFLALCLIVASCKKELGTCKQNQELVSRENTKDVSVVDVQAFRDTLAKYPQLQLTHYSKNTYEQTMRCDLYFSDLLVFSNIYQMWYESSTGKFKQNGFVRSGSFNSTQPGMSADKAIEMAKKHINLDYSCAKYRLGWFMDGASNKLPNYKLAWKIMNAGQSAVFVILDATTGRVYQSSGTYY